MAQRSDFFGDYVVSSYISEVGLGGETPYIDWQRDDWTGYPVKERIFSALLRDGKLQTYIDRLAGRNARLRNGAGFYSTLDSVYDDSSGLGEWVMMVAPFVPFVALGAGLIGAAGAASSSAPAVAPVISETVAPVIGETVAPVFSVSNPWGAGATGLLESTAGAVSSAALPVLDVVAPAATGIGASGAALPLAWQTALGVPGVVAPVFPFTSVLQTVIQPAAPAAPIASRVASSAAPGLLDKLLGTAAVAAAQTLASSAGAKQQADTIAAGSPGALGGDLTGPLLLAAGGFLLYKMAA